jgi:type II secretory pathway component GspD/PulD (secretin)
VYFTLALALQAQPPPGQMPTLPLTQLEERAPAADLDNRTFTLTFGQAVPIKDLLLLLVRGTSLSIVPDPDVAGSFIGELKTITVRQALTLILPPLGLDYAVDRTVVRVFKREPQTRIFTINYIASDRNGTSTVSSGATGQSATAVTTTTRTDVFGELSKGVQTLLSERGAFNVDRKAGLLQVTDFPERLDRVALYLDAVHDRVQRQVQIDARVIEVELKDEKAQSLDLSAVGRRVTDISRLMTTLENQGTVTVLASPRLVTVNNEPAIVRTDVLALSVTPQIGADASLMLSVSPLVKTPVAEADMLARVADGETLVIPGFATTREVRERRDLGIRGGWFGRGTVVVRRRVETLILLTPRIVDGT